MASQAEMTAWEAKIVIGEFYHHQLRYLYYCLSRSRQANLGSLGFSTLHAPYPGHGGCRPKLSIVDVIGDTMGDLLVGSIDVIERRR